MLLYMCSLLLLPLLCTVTDMGACWCCTVLQCCCCCVLLLMWGGGVCTMCVVADVGGVALCVLQCLVADIGLCWCCITCVAVLVLLCEVADVRV